MNSYDVLKQYFGYDSFRPGQEKLVNTILQGRDILGIMPTGAGKSICYQVPAMLLPGITLVISPLISLMKDQVRALTGSGIPAAYVNSTMTENEISAALDLARFGQYRILYVAPERLDLRMFRFFSQNTLISLVAVDEAHCISQWGQDFRPSYLRISEFIDSLPSRPVVAAFTATATQRVERDIKEQLHLDHPEILITGFDRPNLYFGVERPQKKQDYVLSYVKRHSEEAGIIYCATRKNVDELYERLSSRFPERIARYHAGLSAEERKIMQDDFIYDRRPVIVATNAFGMGIDKSDVRYILHYNMPASIENYYQEAGRAGRDGEPAECILLYSPQDIIVQRTLFSYQRVDNGEMLFSTEETDSARGHEFRLQRMIEYCQTNGCLRRYILRYFGEELKVSPAYPAAAPERPESPQKNLQDRSQAADASSETGTDPSGACSDESIITSGMEPSRYVHPEGCRNCSNCCSVFSETDITEESKRIINCIYETGQRFGASVISEILSGSGSKKMQQWHAAERFRMFGALHDHSMPEIRRMIEQLLLENYCFQTDDGYPVLKLTSEYYKLKDPAVRVILREKIRPASRSGHLPADEQHVTNNTKLPTTEPNAERPVRKRKTEKADRSTAGLTPQQKDLFEHLRRLRMEIAREEGVPPYIVFSDKTLKDFAIKCPANQDDLALIYGVGSHKAEKFGDRFLDAIKAYPADEEGAAHALANNEQSVFQESALQESCSKELLQETPDPDKSSCEETPDSGKSFYEETPDPHESSCEDTHDSKIAGASERRKRKENEKEDFYLTQEQASAFPFYTDGYTPGEMGKVLSGMRDETNVRRIYGTGILNHLVELGQITIHNDEDGYQQYNLTADGAANGLISETRTSKSGREYTVIHFPPAAQKYILSLYTKI